MKISPGVATAAKRASEIAQPQSETVHRLNELLRQGDPFSDSQFDAYAIWMERHSGEDGEPDYELLGGETGRRWLDSLMVKAAAVTVDEEEPDIDDVISGAVDYLNLKEQAAFLRVWTVLEIAAKSALRRSVAKAKGSIRNEEVKAKMASAERPLDEVPDKLWQSAKLDTATTHIIDSSIEDAVTEARQVLEEEASLLPRMVEVIGMPVKPGVAGEQARSISNAIKYLENQLPGAIRRWVRPMDAEPRSVLPPSIVRQAMLLAGGADPEEPIENGFPVRQGHPVAAGFGMLNGPLFFEMLRGAPVKTAALRFPDDQLKIAYKWRHAFYRDPITPFQPHKNLNGRVFLLQNWEELQSRKKDPDEFPYVDPVTGEQLESYRIGDHEHCTCAAIPRFESQGGRVYGPDWFDAQLSQEPKAAAFNPRQPRCPKGTGRTAGRFSNDNLTNCNPMVTQLKDSSLQARVADLEVELSETTEIKRSARLQEEIEIAEAEIERRANGGESGDLPDDPTGETEGEPEYGEVEADELAELANEAGGFTVRGGHDSPTEGFGVADPEHTLAITGWADLDDETQDAVIAKYLGEKEAEFINDPDVYLGAWVDSEGTMFLDLTKVVSDRQEAIDLGAERGEQAIFGFADFDEIPTGGTGNEQRFTTAEAFLSATAGGDGAADGAAGSSGVGQVRPNSEAEIAALRTTWDSEQPHPNPEVEAAITGLQERIVAKATARAETLGPEMVAIAETSGAELAGLKHQIKGPGSTMRKLRDRHVERGMALTDEAATAAVKDALRYTFSVESEHYVMGVQKGITSLLESGYESVEMDNAWEQGDAYSGVNSIWRDQSGTQFEVQWHTPASLAIKDLIHEDYEEFRVSKDPVRKRELYFRMATHWDTAPAPMGWPPVVLNTFGGLATLVFRPPPDLREEAA